MRTKNKTEKVLLLRTCNSDMTSYNNFKWPKSGPVKCKDWRKDPICGYGLHGLLRGCGNANLLSDERSAKWLVWEALLAEVVDLDKKVKVPRGKVVYCGNRAGAIELLVKTYPGFPIVFSKITVKDFGVAVVGGFGVAKAGGQGRAVAGDYATAKVGDHGIAITGVYGTAEAGDYGRAVVGVGGKVKAGNKGILQINYTADYRGRVATAYVGENGIKENTFYTLNANGIFTEVPGQET